MTKKQFKSDFFRGLGSALIALQTGDNPKQFYDIVLYGCLHNTTYDMQCEGDRGRYLSEAARLTGEKDAIESAVIQKFLRVKEDTWLFNQLTSILYHFAADGSEAARAALYQQYESMLSELSPKKRKRNGRYPELDKFEWLCVWLTSLDWWSAFKHIVQDISEVLLPKDEDLFFLDWFYSNSQSKFGEERIKKYLQKQSEKSAYIRAYYEKAKEWDNRPRVERPVPTLEQVLAEVDGREFSGRGLNMRFARNADREGRERLVKAAMDEPDTQVKINLLWPFRRIEGFSFPEEFLSQLRESEDYRLREIAIDIMAQNPSAKTCELGRALIKSGEDIQGGLLLLSKNLRPVDEELFCNTVKSFPVRHSERAWHDVFMDAIDGIEAMRGKPKTDILEYLYRQTLCSFCRERIVRLMHKKKALPDVILQECRFDSDLDIRDLAERIIRGRKDVPPTECDV